MKYISLCRLQYLGDFGSQFPSFGREQPGALSYRFCSKCFVYCLWLNAENCSKWQEGWWECVTRAWKGFSEVLVYYSLHYIELLEFYRQIPRRDRKSHIYVVYINMVVDRVLNYWYTKSNSKIPNTNQTTANQKRYKSKPPYFQENLQKQPPYFHENSSFKTYIVFCLWIKGKLENDIITEHQMVERHAGIDFQYTVDRFSVIL